MNESDWTINGAASSGQVWETTPDGSIKAFASEQTTFNVGRLGIWPDTFPNVQVSFDAEAWEQHFRNSTPNTGAFDAGIINDAVAKVFERSGEAVPETMESTSPFGALSGEAVPLEEFMKLTRIPILIFYGGNIPKEVTEECGRDNWRVRLKMARLWGEAVNRHGGDAKLIHLPDLGIDGNTHSLFADLNNEQLADIQEEWMHEKKLDVKQ